MPALIAQSVVTAFGRATYTEEGRGSPLVLLHSLLTDRGAFDQVVPHLAGRVIAFDLPGFGGTSLTGPSIDEYAASMNAAVSAVCGDDSPVTVMGNGLGAFVALGMAISTESVVDRLVLVGCGVTFPEKAKPAFASMIEAAKSGGMPAVTSTALRRIFTEEYLAAHPQQAEERSRVLAGTNPEAFITACRALHELDYTNRVEGVRVPTLVVVGEEDEATPPAMAEDLHASLANSRLKVLRGLAHAPQIQDPAAFINSVRDFLEEV